MGQRAGKTRHRRGHSLVAGDHGLDGALLRGKDLGEEGILSASHSRALSHAGRAICTLMGLVNILEISVSEVMIARPRAGAVPRLAVLSEGRGQ